MSALENAHEEVAAKLVCAEETIVREGVSKAIGEILLGGAEAEPAEDGAEDKAGEEDGDDDDSAEHGEPVLLETDEGISPEAGSFFDDLYPVLR